MNQKPKLLLVADTYYPKVDGTLRFMEEFIKRSSKMFDLTLLVPQLEQQKRSPRNFAITFLEPSRILHISGYPSLKLSFRNVKNITTAIRNADLVFIQGPALISYLSVYYAHKYHKKTVFYMHTIAWELLEKFLPPLLNKILLRVIKRFSIMMYNLCDEIFIPYQDLKTQLAAAGVKTTMTVARLGVDIERFSPTKDKMASKKNIGISQDKKVIGYVGRISKEKNMDVLLNAFLKLPHQEELQLLMVGDGPSDLTTKFKALHNCTITGFVSNVQDYLKAMDIFVMPSLTETTSLATLEAMSCGLPVIASKVGFIKHYLIKDHNGLFFPQSSAPILALKIEKLLHDETIRHNLGKNARRMVAYSFSWERSINRIKRFLMHIYFQKAKR
ncbi:MAG: glycosyltransferase [Nanoarchaeota archaeon]|nr:glycosyltransferase [Nanoarchaeota archaeon]